MKCFGLLDCNNFFVSCERLFRPDLKNTPTIVLSGNDGCVVARSKEVKEMGIPMGVPYFTVKDQLQKDGVVVFSSNFPLYRDVSSRVMEILKATCGSIEQYSVDEAFFTCEGTKQQIQDTLLHVKQTLERQVGVPVSIGAAKTKTIAKYASEQGKKGSGVCLLSGRTWHEHAKKVAIHEIWGVGNKTSQKMRQHNIHTVADFLRVERGAVGALFGVGGARLYDELREIRVHEYGSRDTDQKSIMSTRSFGKATTNRSVVVDALAYHVSCAAAQLRAMHLKAQRLVVMARASKHGSWLLHGNSKEVFLVHPTNDTRELLREAIMLFDSFYTENVPYKKAGVTLGGFVHDSVQQGELFAEEESDRTDGKLMHTIDAINKKFGKDALTIGRCAQHTRWQPNKAHVSPCYTTKWNDIASVQA